MQDRDKRLIKNKKRLSKQYDNLFEKIIEILLMYSLQVKDFNIVEFKKYNRLTTFNTQIKNLLKDFTEEELEIIEEMLVEEFKVSWKEQQSNLHKRVKMPDKETIKEIVNYRHRKDGLTVEEREKRNIEYLQYKIYSTVVKNLTTEKNFEKLAKEDLPTLKKKYVKNTSTRQLQDNITQAENLGCLFLGASLNNAFTNLYNMVANGEKNKESDNDEYVCILRDVGDERVCSLCQGLAGKEFKIGEIFIPQDTHPNCRCYLEIVKKR